MHQTDQLSVGLLVLYQLPIKNFPDSALDGTSWNILSFLPEEDETQFIDTAQANGIKVVEIFRAAKAIESSALETRKKYSTFMEEWPDSFQRHQRSFKQLFTYDDDLSYWWMTNASVKQNEFSSTFEYLCHLEIVKVALGKGSAKCSFVGQDPMMAMLIGRMCQKLGVQFWPTCAGSVSVKGWALYGLSARVWLFFKLLAMLLVFRLFFKTPRALQTKTIGFYTLFPSLSRLVGGSVVDRNYGGLPALVDYEGNEGALFMATFSPNSWRDWSGLWSQRQEIRSQVSVNFLFLESLLTINDLKLVLSNLSFVFQYSWLQRRESAFRESFQYDGIDIFELIAPEFARALLGNQLPSHLVLARLMERALRNHPVIYLVCFLELYPTARAVYYGAQKSATDVRTIAYQHASISSMKLWYTYRPGEVIPPSDNAKPFLSTMPIPDRYLFQGENGLRVILESGYPRERCMVTGSPRYDDLGDLLSAQENTAPEASTPPKNSTKKVLVIPSLSDQDGLELVEASVKACSQLGIQTEILVKPHPSSAIGEQVSQIRDRHGFANFSVTQKDLYQLIQEADVVVTSYSTVGDEAIALGCPVICYTGLRPSMSSFVDIAAAPLVHDAGELGATLERIFSDPDYLETYKREWPALVKGSFFRLDGRADLRMLEFLLGQDFPR